MGANDSNSPKFKMKDASGVTQVYDKNPSALTRFTEKFTMDEGQANKVNAARAQFQHDASAGYNYHTQDVSGPDDTK